MNVAWEQYITNERTGSQGMRRELPGALELRGGEGTEAVALAAAGGSEPNRGAGIFRCAGIHLEVLIDYKHMYKIKNILIVLLLVTVVPTAAGQNKARMQQLQQQLSDKLEMVSGAATDNERYLASEEAVQLLTQALQEEHSEKWRWSLPDVASVLSAPDGNFRIFTWAVIRDDGEFECFGAVQYYDEKEEEYTFQVLNDKSEEIMNREESTLSPDKWMGAVYQELIQTSAGGRTCYTLLGWNGVDNITDRKIIEPVMIRNGKVQFGAPVFRRERNQRRVILEYANNAMVNLGYEEQFIREVKRERVKVKGSNRYRTVETYEDHKERMIIFDEVAPQVPGMDGIFHYYMPSGNELAYTFVDGKWEMRDGAEGRLADKKLNKEFEPLPKSTPAYIFGK